MRLMRLLVAVIMLISLACGCSRGHSPTWPEEPMRAPARFADSVAIFEPSDALIEDAAGFHEIDLAEMRGGWNFLVDESYQHDGWTTGAVTLQRGVSCSDPFKPVVRFLQGSVPSGDPVNGNQSNVHWVSWWDATAYPPGSHPADYRHPKCDSIVFQRPGGGLIVELAVVYQIRGLSDQEVLTKVPADFHGSLLDERNNGPGDWDIGGTILRWPLEYWPNGTPERYDFIVPDNDYESQFPDTDPDVAYDRSTGDLYIVYSKAETPQGLYTTKIRYVMLERSYDPEPYPPYPLLFTGLDDPGWGDPGHWPRIVPPAGMGEHNGHTPSVAIGLLDFFIHDEGPPPSHHWIENRRWICIAYTSQFLNQTGFHVVAGGWELASGYGSRYFMDLRHPDYGEFDAGLPCLSITPSNSRRNFASLVLTQITGSDGYGPRAWLYELDLFAVGEGQLHNAGNWFQMPALPYYHDSLFPSVALHYNSTEEGPFLATVSFMAQEPEGDILCPAAGNIEIELEINDHSPPYLQANRTAPEGALAIDDAAEIEGNYNISQIPFIDPGITTAVVLADWGQYWAAWSERIEMEPPPQYVYGTYGWAGE